MTEFHDTFQKVFDPILSKEVYDSSNPDIGYYRGPTKGFARMSEKIKDYVKEDAEGEKDKQFPHTACITSVRH